MTLKTCIVKYFSYTKYMRNFVLVIINARRLMKGESISLVFYM